MLGGDSTQTVNAGLPNIEGDTGLRKANESTTTGVNGAFVYKDSANTLRPNYSGGQTTRQALMFNADLSNPIYGNSDTVQPPAICLIPQVKF